VVARIHGLLSPRSEQCACSASLLRPDAGCALPILAQRWNMRGFDESAAT